MSRLEVGLSLVEAWWRYGSRRIEFEVKRRRAEEISAGNRRIIEQLGGRLQDGQRSMIDNTDPTSRVLAESDFRSVPSIQRFNEEFPGATPTESLSVLERRNELLLNKWGEVTELMDDHREKLVAITKKYLKSFK